MKTFKFSGFKLPQLAGGNRRRASFQTFAIQRYNDLAVPIREDSRHARLKLMAVRDFRVVRG